MNSVNIYIAMHKPYHTPEDELYIPLQVGAVNHERFCAVTDANGTNISAKNDSFCELTGLYWIWKNVDAETVGMVHYRRYFAQSGKSRDPWKRILTRDKLDELMKSTDIILPKARHYVIETNLSHYAHAHNAKDLLAARECIRDLFPDCLPAFDRVMRKTHGHRFNMMIMKKPVLDRYCEWLFPVLFQLEERLDITAYNDYNHRVYGFIGERLLDVWLMHSGIRYAELKVVDIETVHWIKKGLKFLKRKIKPRPYMDESNLLHS